MDHGESSKRNRPTPRAPAVARYLWRAHAALLLFVGGYTASCAFVFTTPDANIGLGLGLDALGAMGAPWTVPVYLDEHFDFDSALFVVVAAGAAVLNLALHAAGLRWCSAVTAHRR